MPGEEAPGAKSHGLENPRAPWEEPIEDPAAPRALLAVMFTDIVGSTELAGTLGDSRWRELVDQHHAAIRAEIARFGGREVDTAGDAFFATFDRPLLAVECAQASVRAVRRLGLLIRAGVHMGECVVSGPHVRGVTVHIGARIGAKAAGGEVLVSSTVRDVIGTALSFRDRGEQTLKGVEGRWRIYDASPKLEEPDLPPLLEAAIPPPSVPAWKKPRVLLAAATALAVLAAAIAFAVTRGGGLSSVPADSVATIDAESGDILSYVAVRRRPVGLTVTPEGIWVANSIDRSLTHIDNQERRRTISVGPGPIEVAAGGGQIWVANADGRSVSRVSPVSGNEVGDRIVAGNGLSAVAYGAGALWLANAVDGTVWRIDPGSGKTTHKIPVGPGVRGLAVTSDAVWASSEVAGTITRLDPRSGAIVRVVPVGNGPGAVAVGAGSVWVANAYDGTIFRIDALKGTVTDTIRVGRGPRAVAIARGHVFVANEDSSTVSMIDARTGSLVREIPLANAPMGLTAADDRVWVSVRGGILRYKGGTLRIGTRNVVSSLDPSFAADLVSIYLMPAVYDGLTAFKHVGGHEGTQLVPNLAEEIRPPTDDGLTYSFTLRAGLTYSDGSAVRASDVRTTFERIIRNQQYGAQFLGALKGIEGCTPARCDLSSSIVTDDAARTVVFHLTHPFSDFPYVLAIPVVSIVPSTAPAGDGGPTPIPGTGPYRFGGVELRRGDDGAFTSGQLTLERNPRFKSRGLAQPDAYPDRIELTMGGQPEEHVEAVRNGRSDFTPDLFLPGLPLMEVSSQFPSQVHAADLTGTLFADLNTQVPPFNDLRARRALNLAVDRAAVVRATGGSLRAEVSCQLLPENMIGYEPYCPYTKDRSPTELWSGPDIIEARRLVAESGTRGQSVTVWIEEGDSEPARIWRAAAPSFVSALDAIGYRASLRSISGGEPWINALLDPNSKRQIMIMGWITDYPGPANFFLPLTTCPETLGRLGQEGIAFTRHCSPAIDRLVLQALDRQAKDPVGSAELWASVDRAITDEAPLVNIYNGRGIYFVSDRVGNVQGHTTYSVLISQMWVTEPGTPSPTPG